MRADTRIQLIAALLLVVCIAGSGLLTVAIAAESGRAQLGYADTVEQSDPPEVALGVAMGAFRGLFVNILWIRAEKLKQEGKFHEAMELARTITRLQPRFPRVWGFQAWNMAYNISVATQTAEERWQWIEAGIKLLRDEGIPKNPNDMLLHKELAWIFVHKIQGINDDANRYYKRALAREWTWVMGPPPPRAETVEDSTKQYAAWLQQVIDAPDTLDELYAKHPRARELVRRIEEEAKLGLDINLLRHNELQRALVNAARNQGVQLQLREEERSPAFEQILNSIGDDKELIDAYRALILHVRKRLLIDTYHMEPQRMKRYTELYGPLDWRHPATHALYWATRGVEEGRQRVNTEDFDQTNTDRVVTHALQELFRWGQIYYDPLSDSYLQMLDLDFTDTYGRILKEELQPRATKFEDPNRVFRLFALGYENFLRDVVRIYYRLGMIDKAEQYFKEIRTGEWKNTNAPNAQLEEYGKTLAEYVELDMQERLTSPEFAASEVYSVLLDAYMRGLLRGDLNVFTRDMEYAQRVHQIYMQKQNVRTTADVQNRMEFMPGRFVDVAAGAFVAFVMQGDVPPWQLSRMWGRLVHSSMRAVAQAAYDTLVTNLKPRMSDFDQWFPEPPGMEEYRAARKQLFEQSDNARKQDISGQPK